MKYSSVFHDLFLVGLSFPHAPLAQLSTTHGQCGAVVSVIDNWVLLYILETVYIPMI